MAKKTSKTQSKKKTTKAGKATKAAKVSKAAASKSKKKAKTISKKAARPTATKAATSAAKKSASKPAKKPAKQTGTTKAKSSKAAASPAKPASKASKTSSKATRSPKTAPKSQGAAKSGAGKAPTTKPASGKPSPSGGSSAKKSTTPSASTKASSTPANAKPAAKSPAKTSKRDRVRFRYVPPEAEEQNGQTIELTLDDLKKVKTGLKKKDLLYFKRLLLEKRAELLGDVESMTLARDAARGGDVSHMPLHMADVGSDNFEQEFMLGLMEADQKLLVEIDEALRRIQDGYYGVCLDRGVPIGRPRLEAKPWAKYCIEAVRERERRGQW